MERESKKRKLFQDVLPAEMIENIVFLCPNTITLQSLACTCKQIKQLVAKTVNKEILLTFRWIKRRTQKHSADYTLRNDGTAIKSSDYSFKTQGSNDKKSKTALKMLEDRDKFNALYNEVLSIMNMTDTSKFTEIIQQNKDDPLFDLKVDEITFDIEIDNTLVYSYTTKTKKDDDALGEGNLIPDVPPQKLSWNYLDEKMVNRLKCALCAIKIRDWFKTIPYMASKGQKSLSIEYREDAVEYQGWDFNFNDSGHITGLAFDFDDEPWRFRDEKQIESIQLTPSFVNETFIELEKYINSEKIVKLKQELSGEKEVDDDSANKAGSELESAKENDASEEDSSGSEEEDEESDLNEESFQGRRTVKININGTTFKMERLKAKYFEKFMKIVFPIARCIDTPMLYE